MAEGDSTTLCLYTWIVPSEFRYVSISSKLVVTSLTSGWSTVSANAVVSRSSGKEPFGTSTGFSICIAQYSDHASSRL